jgi:hypothetical protein
VSAENTLYTCSPISERPQVSWTGGAKVAFYVGLNVEHFQLGVPSTSIRPHRGARAGPAQPRLARLRGTRRGRPELMEFPEI